MNLNKSEQKYLALDQVCCLVCKIENRLCVIFQILHTCVINFKYQIGSWPTQDQRKSNKSKYMQFFCATGTCRWGYSPEKIFLLYFTCIASILSIIIFLLHNNYKVCTLFSYQSPFFNCKHFLDIVFKCHSNMHGCWCFHQNRF